MCNAVYARVCYKRDRVNKFLKRDQQSTLEEISDEDKAISFGQLDPSLALTVISWGSTKGAILDALDQLALEGKRVHFVQVRLMNPFPRVLLERMLLKTKILVDIEMNHTSQLGSLVSEYLHRNIEYRVVKYNGRPMSSSEIYNSLTQIINGNAPRRTVLDNGA